MEQNEDGDEDLHFDDKAKCDALAAYLTTLLPVNATEVSSRQPTNPHPHTTSALAKKQLCVAWAAHVRRTRSQAVAAKETDHGGATVINKKMLDDEEFWGQHKKTKGKKKKKAVVAKAAMTHPMDRIQSLHDFGLDVPNDIAAVMVAIKKVLAKKAEYLAKGASAPKKVVRVYRCVTIPPRRRVAIGWCALMNAFKCPSENRSPCPDAPVLCAGLWFAA